MRVFLIGSKQLSCLIFDELIGQGHQVLGVYSRDNEPGMEIWHSLGHRNLAEEARKIDIPVYQNMKVNSPESITLLAKLNLDIIISCFWSEIFKETLLNIPKLGVYNFHTAYLPKNRGSRPIPWALINSDNYTGISMHRMMKGVDNGPIVAQKKVPITDNDTAETLYYKVTIAGGELIKEVLPKFSNNSYTLTPQDEEQSTYHPRGEPFGGQINPYWSTEIKDRFIRAFYFPPFKKQRSEPKNTLDGETPRVYVMLGLDCDRPRGIYAFGEKGRSVAIRKLKSLQQIKAELDQLEIKRTYFICGQFLESMATLFGKDEIKRIFGGQPSLVEIGDHTYHHEILNIIPTRPDKKPLSPKELNSEILRCKSVFEDNLDISLLGSGLRAPLGYYNGMHNQFKSLDVLIQHKSYISTDLRDNKYSLNPKLYDNEGRIRQPYRYENGLLEIPAIGWQDTVFLGTSKTPIYEDYPKTFDEIIAYYTGLFREAKDAVVKFNRDIFVGLTLHPLDNSYYNENRNFFPLLKKGLSELNGKFITYGDVCQHYNKTEQ